MRMDSSRPAQEVDGMQSALVVEWFLDIPSFPIPDHSGNIDIAWRLQHQRAVDRFRRLVMRRYQLGSLERLLDSDYFRCRQAAAFALGLVGLPANGPMLWRMLGDSSPEVRNTVQDSLWNLWFRGSTESHNQELRRIIRMGDKSKALRSINALLRKAPHFAEAYNQRAILHFRLENPLESIADCQKALELNPYHFGAQAGLGQCYLQLGRDQAALNAFVQAQRLNPNLDRITETIDHLERIVGGKGIHDDFMRGV